MGSLPPTPYNVAMRRLLLGLLLLAATAAAQGDLKIHVTWEGPLPKRQPLTIPDLVKQRSPADAAFCQKCIDEKTLFDERIVVDEKSRGLRDVAVLVAGPDPGKGPRLPSGTLDNRKCRFHPRVQFVPLASKLTVKNSDRITHNARILGRGGRQFWNGIIPAGKAVQTYTIPVGGTYHVVCDVHPWMEAWFIGTKSPWAGVSSADGTVALRKIPTEEEISIHLWHPTLGSAHLKTRLAPDAETLKRLTQKDFRKR